MENIVIYDILPCVILLKGLKMVTHIILGKLKDA